MVTLLGNINPAYYKDFIYIASREKNHVCRIQEGYIWNYIGITTILKKISKRLEEMVYQRKKYDCCFMKKMLMVRSASYSGMLTTRRYHMLILSFSLALLLTLIQNMEKLRKLPPHRVKETNTRDEH